MFPKTLLTVVGSEQSTDGLGEAISLCQEFGCHLAVTVIGIALPASTTAYGAVPAEISFKRTARSSGSLTDSALIH